jgi:hypothetical protein
VSTRRTFLNGNRIARWNSVVKNAFAQGQAPAAPALPLKNLGSRAPRHSCARHCRFCKSLHADPSGRSFTSKPFQGGIRYFIHPASAICRKTGRWVTSLSALREIVLLPIGHYCALAERYDRAGVASALQAAGFSSGTGGGFGMLPDPDGIELQLLSTSGRSCDCPRVTVNASGRVQWPREAALVWDHVLLHVSDIEKSLPYYHLVYGANIKTTRQSNPGTGCGFSSRRTTTHRSGRRFPRAKKPRMDQLLHQGLRRSIGMR